MKFESSSNFFLLFSFLEFYSRFIIAKSAHKRFLQLTDSQSEASNEQIQEFLSAEKNYQQSTKSMSQRLADSYINFDHFSIGIGLVCLCTVRYLFPTITSIRIQFITLKHIPFLFIGIILHGVVFPNG